MTINKIPRRFRRSMLALAACTAVAPNATWALGLASVPPGTQESYVAPNVIISIDDSGSMNFRLNETTKTPAADNSITAPDPITGTWDVKAARINILKYALKQVFSDTTILPDKKIRLAWQAMWNNGKSPGVGRLIIYLGRMVIPTQAMGVQIMSMAPALALIRCGH